MSLLEPRLLAGAAGRDRLRVVEGRRARRGDRQRRLDSTATFPAGDRGVIGVSTHRPRATRSAASSNYGPDTFLAAPGENILTTLAGGGYGAVSGTSASAAMVAGAAALLKATSSRRLQRRRRRPARAERRRGRHGRPDRQRPRQPRARDRRHLNRIGPARRRGAGRRAAGRSSGRTWQTRTPATSCGRTTGRTGSPGRRLPRTVSATVGSSLTTSPSVGSGTSFDFLSAPFTAAGTIPNNTTLNSGSQFTIFNNAQRVYRHALGPSLRLRPRRVPSRRLPARPSARRARALPPGPRNTAALRPPPSAPRTRLPPDTSSCSR